MFRIGLDLNRGKFGEPVDWDLAQYLERPHSDVVQPWREQSGRDSMEVLQFAKTLPFAIDAATQQALRAIPDPPNMSSTISGARKLYGMCMQFLIEDSHLQPRFYWSSGAWNIDMDSEGCSNLLAVLTAQLMLKVSSANTQIKCSECPRWFIPRRNQRKYCDRCGIQAAWRAAQRKRRG